ncbi:MAG: TRAP transporter large permease subunit [Parahaliea sp.]
MLSHIALFMFAVICILLMLGYPVAFTMAGTALLFAAVGIIGGVFDAAFLSAMPGRLYSTIGNETLIAVPLFILMGVALEKSRIAEELLSNMTRAFGRIRGGLGISVIIVGTLLAASTGIVGATVITMGLLSLPSMLKSGYRPSLAAGTICATGTLGQIIPPSIALILLGDVLSSAYQQAQLSMNIFNPKVLSVGDLFTGALIPGLLLILCYSIYLLAVSRFRPEDVPLANEPAVSLKKLLLSTLPPIALIILVLGSILTGAATPGDAAGIGAVGALLLVLSQGQLNITLLKQIALDTTRMTCMVFTILIGASIFSLVFRGFGGDALIHGYFNNLPGGTLSATAIVMLVIFLLGFILDFIEITFVVIPIVGPTLLQMGIDPVWLGIIFALNLQTSFLTPPFGFALFYLRGVAPDSLPTSAIYRGVIPFIIIQLLVITAIWLWPPLATWLPAQLSDLKGA